MWKCFGTAKGRKTTSRRIAILAELRWQLLKNTCPSGILSVGLLRRITWKVVCFAREGAIKAYTTHFILNTKPFVVIKTPYFSIVALSPEPTSQMRLKSLGLTYTKFDKEYFPGRALFAATVSCTVEASAIVRLYMLFVRVV